MVVQKKWCSDVFNSDTCDFQLIVDSSYILLCKGKGLPMVGDYFFSWVTCLYPIHYLIFYILLIFKYIIMIITADVLKEFLDHVPGDFEIVFRNDDVEYFVNDNVEVDLSGKKIILKS